MGFYPNLSQSQWDDWYSQREQRRTQSQVRITEQMATAAERNWTAHVVIASGHAGLAPHFKEMESEMYRVLARVDDPLDVREYLVAMGLASREWLRLFERVNARR
jgi:hypothetical protein